MIALFKNQFFNLNKAYMSSKIIILKLLIYIFEG